jgi:hypothetical protein
MPLDFFSSSFSDQTKNLKCLPRNVWSAIDPWTNTLILEPRFLPTIPKYKSYNL